MEAVKVISTRVSRFFTYKLWDAQSKSYERITLTSVAESRIWTSWNECKDYADFLICGACGCGKCGVCGLQMPEIVQLATSNFTGDGRVDSVDWSEADDATLVQLGHLERVWTQSDPNLPTRHVWNCRSWQSLLAPTLECAKPQLCPFADFFRNQHVLDMLDKQKLCPPADLSRLVVKAFHSPKSPCCFCFKPNKTACPWPVWPYRYGLVFAHEHHKRVCERNWIRVQGVQGICWFKSQHSAKTKEASIESYAVMPNYAKTVSIQVRTRVSCTTHHSISCTGHLPGRVALCLSRHSRFKFNSRTENAKSENEKFPNFTEFTSWNVDSTSLKFSLPSTRHLSTRFIDSSMTSWPDLSYLSDRTKIHIEKKGVEDSKAVDLWYFCDTFLRREPNQRHCRHCMSCEATDLAMC